MYRRLKNVLSGLAMASVALVGGVLFGEPVPPRTEHARAPLMVVTLASAPAAAPIVVDLPELWSDLREEGVRIRLVTPVSSVEVEPVRRRDGAFQMPYFSFGATLPRAPSPSES